MKGVLRPALWKARLTCRSRSRVAVIEDNQLHGDPGWNVIEEKVGTGFSPTCCRAPEGSSRKHLCARVLQAWHVYEGPVAVFHAEHAAFVAFALNCICKFSWTLEIAPHVFPCLENNHLKVFLVLSHFNILWTRNVFLHCISSLIFKRPNIKPGAMGYGWLYWWFVICKK